MKFSIPLLSLFCTGLLFGQTIEFVHTFDDPVDLDQWAVDRIAPGGFESVFFDGDNRLRVTTVQNFSGGSPNFQGRSLSTPGAISVFGDFFLPDQASAESQTEFINVSLWAVGEDANGDPSSFSFLAWEADDFIVPDPGFTFATGANPDGEYVDTPPDPIVFNSWYSFRLDIDLEAGLIRHFINDVEVATTGTGDTVVFRSLILQHLAINGEEPWEAYWDNVGYTIIPEPSVVALGIGGLVFGFVIWRRSRRSDKKISPTSN